ncbi:ankyrin repeat domain-containing protein [Glutamicibacter sp. NPDC087344]|uniref:ankyrin repeat domain-containing protein n=1 Tax=Glutamicibacter sp. NPDC087344 TaxID=3363994 RepID=UPI003820F42A
MAKRKTLPKNFEEMLGTASLDELKAVFNKCLLDARGGYNKCTALGFVDCPDALVTWLVEQGLEVDAEDTYGATALWQRARWGRTEQLPLLVALGAGINKPRSGGVTPLHAAAEGGHVEAARILLDAGAQRQPLTDGTRQTPLHYALSCTSNAQIPGTAQIAQLLLAEGEPVTVPMQEEVTRIGKSFEQFRESFNPDYLEQTDAALHRLYELFDVTPVSPRLTYDGHSPIILADGPWQKQHEQLWELLVPASGVATTVQGEVIRVSGRIANEILGNGSINWDKDFRAMADAVLGYVNQGQALPPALLSAARDSAKSVRSGTADDRQVYRLSELAVAWVRLNPTPISLEQVAYRR